MYTLSSAPSAERDIERMKRGSKQDFERLSVAIRALADEPRPHGVRRIRGSKDSHRVRVGNHRIIYRINDAAQTVVVLHVRRRNETTYRA